MITRSNFDGICGCHQHEFSPIFIDGDRDGFNTGLVSSIFDPNAQSIKGWLCFFHNLYVAPIPISMVAIPLELDKSSKMLPKLRNFGVVGFFGVDCLTSPDEKMKSILGLCCRSFTSYLSRSNDSHISLSGRVAKGLQHLKNTTASITDLFFITKVRTWFKFLSSDIWRSWS